MLGSSCACSRFNKEDGDGLQRTMKIDGSQARDLEVLRNDTMGGIDRLARE